jgi:hypothetical protein
MVLKTSRLRWPGMMDITTIDNKDRQRAAEPELRDWELQDEHRREPWSLIPERKTATARWGRAVVIMAALSTLSWTVIVLLVIAAVAYL